MTQTLRERIKELRENGDPSLHESAKRAKISPPLLSDVELSGRYLNDETVRQLAPPSQSDI